MKTNRRERELGKEIDSAIGEMTEMYGTPGGVLDEEAEMDRRLSDIALGNDVTSHVEEVLRLEKLSEHLLDVEHKKVTYELCMKISPDGIETKMMGKSEVKVT